MNANQLPTTQAILKTDEAAVFLTVGKRTIQELVASGQLMHIKIGRSIRFDVNDLRKFIESRKKVSQ